MKERNTLIELIRTLHPREFQALKQFVEFAPTTLHLNSGEAHRLLNVILETAPEFEENRLSKKQLYDNLYPGEPWLNGRLKKVMMALHKLVQAFLLFQYYFREGNAIQRQIDLARIYHDRGLQTRFERLLEKTQHQLEQTEVRYFDYYFQNFQIEYALSELAIDKNQTRWDLNLQRLLQNLGTFYHLRRLDLLNYFLNQQNVAQLEEDGPIAFALNENPPHESFLAESSNLFIQHKIFELCRREKPTPEDFWELANLLRQKEPVIAPTLLLSSYTQLRNLCVRLIYRGFDEYYEILHELHRDNLVRGYLYHPEYQGKITPNTFLNIVSVGLKTHHYDWVLDFLVKYRDKINGDNETGDFYKLTMSIYLFAIGKFTEALDNLPPAFPNVNYHLMSRRLEIKIYYELQSDLLEFKIDAFKMYISRASKKFLSADLRERNADFTNLLTQILQSKPGDPNRKPRLLKRIQERVWMADRDWLIEKVNQIK